MVIGHRVKQARLNKKMTQKEIAALLNVAVRTVQDYEKKHHLSTRTLTKIAKVLDVPLSFFVEGGAETQPVAILELMICVEELAELQKEISKLARGYDNKASLVEEIADVVITIDTIKEITGISFTEIEAEIKRKKERNQERRAKGEFYNG